MHSAPIEDTLYPLTRLVWRRRRALPLPSNLRPPPSFREPTSAPRTSAPEPLAPLPNALAKQRRDALSITEEGSGQRGARSSQHYAIALGSALWAAIALEVAVAWGYLEEVPQSGEERFRIVIASLVKLERR